MKGLLFTELLEMVEEDFGYSTANAIVLNAGLSSKGIYTSARTYHRNEMSLLFERLHHYTKLPFEELAKSFGRHLCKRMLIAYPQHIPYLNRVFAFITKKESSPVFEYLHCDGKTLTLLYHPLQKTDCLTDGVIHGYLEHLQQLNRIEETPLQNGKRKYV